MQDTPGNGAPGHQPNSDPVFLKAPFPLLPMSCPVTEQTTPPAPPECSVAPTSCCAQQKATRSGWLLTKLWPASGPMTADSLWAVVCWPGSGRGSQVCAEEPGGHHAAPSPHSPHLTPGPSRFQTSNRDGKASKNQKSLMWVFSVMGECHSWIVCTQWGPAGAVHAPSPQHRAACLCTAPSCLMLESCWRLCKLPSSSPEAGMQITRSLPSTEHPQRQKRIKIQSRWMSNYLHLHILQASRRNWSLVCMRLLVALAWQFSWSQSNTGGALPRSALFQNLFSAMASSFRTWNTTKPQSYLKYARSHLLHVIDFHV